MLDHVVKWNIKQISDLDHPVKAEVHFGLSAGLAHENELATRASSCLAGKS